MTESLRAFTNRLYAQHVGDANGRIAVWLDKEGALALANTFGPGDAAYDELLAAVERAYPEDYPAEWDVDFDRRYEDRAAR